MAARSTIEDFDVLESIGHGSFGTVFRVLRKLDGQIYALKEIELEGLSESEQHECIQETRMLASLGSPYIIKYFDSFLHEGKLCIVTEYACNGNLHDYIQSQKRRLPEDLVWRLFIQVLLGLHHMHSRKVLHRDIKTLNIFLDDELHVKLGDLGVAKVLTSTSSFAHSLVGTPYYLSPELCEDRPYNYKSDVWALGVVLYECCVQKHPFDANNQGALILKILRGRYPPVSGYSGDLTDIIKRCLTQNTAHRPNTARLLQLTSVKRKAAELGIALPPGIVPSEPCQVQATAKRGPVSKLQPVPAAARPGDALSTLRPKRDPLGAIPSQRVRPGQPARPQMRLPASKSSGQGVIRVMGNMNSPPQAAPAKQPAPVYTMHGIQIERIVKQQGHTSRSLSPTQDAELSPRGRTQNSHTTARQERGQEPGWGEALANDGECDSQAATSSSADFVPTGGGGLRIHKIVGADKAFVFGSGSAPGSSSHLHVSVSGTELTCGDAGDDGDAQGSTWPLEATWKVVQGNARPGAAGGGDNASSPNDDMEASGSDEDGNMHPDDDTQERRQRIQVAWASQKELCVNELGKDAFLQLHALLRRLYDEEARLPDLEPLRDDAIFHKHPLAMQMMCKLLYLEGQLDN